MTKIAIISQAEQGVLIDISGCSSLSEAKQYLTSTLQVSSQFWEGLVVDLNLGPLVLTAEQVNEIQAIVSDVGVHPRQIFSLSPITRTALLQCRLPLGMIGQLQGYASMKPLELESVAEFTETKVNLHEAILESSYAFAPDGELLGSAARGDGGAAGSLDALAQSTYAEASMDPVPARQASLHNANNAYVNPFYATEAYSGDTIVETSGVATMQASITNQSSLNSATAMIDGEFTASAENGKLPDFVVALLGDKHLDPLSFAETQAIPNRLSMPNHHKAPAMPAPASSTPNKAKQTSATSSASAKATAPAAVLLMKQTLRSGQSVCHKGHLVIIGDVNPGAELVADGDITVWGALRGMAHAGASGNTNAEIRALKFDALQLRIAHAIARSPDRQKGGANTHSGPETARVIDGKIRLSVSDLE